MKILKLLSLCIVSLAFSQNTRFVYQVTMKQNASDKNDITTEQANLDVTPKGSIFYSAKNVVRDSIFAKARQTQNFSSIDRSQMENLRSAITYTINKDYAKQDITFNNRIGRDQYSYTENKPFQWKIGTETVKIGEYNTQKAETTYGGRTWNVWFTTDVPFQDGPYKFSGLPGLIVKAEDTSGDYSFDLMQTKKIAAPYEPQNQFRGGQVINVKKADYVKMEDRYRKDPVAFMQASNNSGGGGRFGGGGGGGVAISAPMSRGGGRGGNGPDPQRMKEMQQRMVDEVNKTNNLIELK